MLLIKNSFICYRFLYFYHFFYQLLYFELLKYINVKLMFKLNANLINKNFVSISKLCIMKIEF